MSLKHDKFGTMEEEFSEYDFLGVEALDENDLSEDDESEVKISVSSDEFRYIDPNTLLSPDKIVDGRELFSAKSYGEYVQYLNMFMGSPNMSELTIGYDIETNAEDPLSPDIRIVGFSIADNPYRGIYVVGESLDFVMNSEEWEAIVNLTLQMFDLVKSVVVHNLGYEVPVTLNQWGYEFSPEKLEDTLAQGRTAYPREPAGLKPMSALHLGFSDWDSELSTYLGSIKSIVNALVHIDTARGARKRYNPEDLELRDKVFTLDSDIDTELLYGYLTSLQIPVGSYGPDGKFNGTPDQIEFKIIPKVIEMLEVLSLNGIMNNYIFKLIIRSIVTHANAGGFTTSVPPYSIVPSELISRYGALDAVATVALREHLNEYMRVKSAEVRLRQDRALGHSTPTSTFDLYEGYLNVKYQYFAGQYLEMSGAYWNDEVAIAERKWYEDTSVQSWHNFVQNDEFKDTFLSMNLDSYLYRLVRESVISLNSDPVLYELWIPGGSSVVPEEMSLLRSQSYESLNDVQKILLDHISEYAKFDGSLGNYIIQKSQIKYYDRISETVNSKTGLVTSKPEVVKLKSFYEDLPGEVIDKLKPYVISILLEDVSKVDTIAGAKAFLNLSSTTDEMKQVLTKLLVTQEVLVGRLMEVLTSETQDTENFTRHWLDFNGNTLQGYEETKDLYDLLEDEGRIKLSHGVQYREVYDKFVALLEVILARGYDGVLINKIIESQEYSLDKLNEPAMIDLYRYSVLAGADVDDESTWSDGFRGLYDFRMYKKCVKMISSYIDGRVGRKSVRIVDKSDVNSALPKRKRTYYEEYVSDDVLGYSEDEMTIFTMRFAVAMAETGRWRCLSGGTEIPLLDGRVVPIKDLVGEEDFYVYSYDHQQNKIVPGLAKGAFISGVNASMVRVTLDNGEIIETTPEHKFMLRNGHFREASKLEEGQSLMPLYRGTTKDGYEEVYQMNTDTWQRTHHISQEMIYGPGWRSNDKVSHHKDFNKHNNDPRNLCRMDRRAHYDYHSRKGWTTAWAVPETRELFTERARLDMIERNSDPEYRKKLVDGLNEFYSDEERSNTTRQAHAETLRRRNYEGLSAKANRAMRDKLESDPEFKRGVKVSGASNLISGMYYNAYLVAQESIVDGVVCESTFHKHRYLKVKGDKSKVVKLDTLYSVVSESEVLDGSVTKRDLAIRYRELKSETMNHKVVKVEFIENADLVYDLHVEKHHNFAVESGVIVHNSGFHTVPSGSTIKNIYSSRFDGGVIVAPDYCLVPETRIKLLDGTSPTVKELYETHGIDGTYEVYSYDHESGEVRPGTARHTRITKTTDKVYRVTLDNDKVVECTDNHPFLLRDGTYRRADELSSGDSLMPMYFEIDEDHRILNGYEVIHHPTGRREYTHHLVSGIHLGHRDPNNKSQLYRHHINGNRLDNRSENLELMTASEHMSHHMTEFHANPENAGKVSAWMKKAWNDPEYRLLKTKSTAEQWNDPEYRRRMTETARSVGKRLGSDLHVQAKRTHQKHSKLLRLTYEMFDMELTEENYAKMLEHHNYKRMIKFSTLVEKYGIAKMYEMAMHYNHKVKSVEVIDRVTEVYDLEVDTYHNFLIDLGDNSGIFVHNSQLEVRVIGASAKEEGLLQAFRDGVDVHSSIARIVWNKPEVTEAERRYSKMVTFGILYGADEVNIANNFMNGDIDRATELVSNFYAGYPKLKVWVDSKHQEWKDTGFVTLMTNRMIKIPKPDYNDPKKRYMESKALRQAQNFPINYSGIH